ncbi:MAG TPA: FAD-dependent oxidoreductase [Burkholderiaceae bacterium]|nr:FAD-dependent oxidoreductase [Burkholderiaceae bacterium]
MSTDVVDCLVIGGGLVGASVAYGAAKSGASTLLLDEGDAAVRASRGNFGLVWVQGKGDGLPVYAAWTRQARLMWTDFAAELLADTGVDVQLRETGGYWFGFSDEEMEQRQAMLQPLWDQGGVPFQMLDYSDLKARVPRIGPAVVGGSFCPLDAHVNPLRLLHALHKGMTQAGTRLINGAPVQDLAWDDGIFTATVGTATYRARRVVLAAGLGNRKLAPMLGLHAPVVPNRGQILVTERLQPFLASVTNKARQTEEGSVQLGSTEEDVGYDDRTTLPAMKALARRGVQTFPLLANAKLVRAWGALRVMTPDGFPIYEESAECPGAFIVTCHSGVTLSALHCKRISAWILGNEVNPDSTRAFSSGRFSKGEPA